MTVAVAAVAGTAAAVLQLLSKFLGSAGDSISKTRPSFRQCVIAASKRKAPHLHSLEELHANGATSIDVGGSASGYGGSTNG